jgi:hypothetical protein
VTSIEEAWKAFDRMLASHIDHNWRKIGGCVYCTDCDVRLYHGDLPEEKR